MKKMLAETIVVLYAVTLVTFQQLYCKAQSKSQMLHDYFVQRNKNCFWRGIKIIICLHLNLLSFSTKPIPDTRYSQRKATRTYLKHQPTHPKSELTRKL